MPEHQASSSQPSPRHSSDANGPSHRDTTAPLPPETAKRTYLSLLPPPQLIDLILAFDANRETLIFPHDLENAIKALQRPHRSPAPRAAKDPPPSVSVIVKAEPVSNPIPPPSAPSKQPQPPVVQSPQYTPTAQYYPYTHTPYYTPPPVPRSKPLPSASHVSPPTLPQRNPLFTSTPLVRDPKKLPPPHPPPLVSSRDDPNAMPSYEEMIVAAILDVGQRDGTAPKVLFSWMASHYPLQQNFRPSASQALHKALKRGRLEKIGGKYRLNPTWGGGPTTSKRATRRPTANRGMSPHPQPPAHSHPQQNGNPHPHGHPPQNLPYGFPPHMHHHPSLPAAHAPAQVVTQETDGAESEDMDAPEDSEAHIEEGEATQQDEGEKQLSTGRRTEEIRRSLVELAKVLRRIASKEAAT